MRKWFLGALLIPVVSAAVSTWKDYPVLVPEWCVGVYELAVNSTGEGYAFIHDGVNTGQQYLLHLRNGVWTPSTPPPVHLARPSIAADGTVYGVDDRGSGAVYRCRGTSWEKVAECVPFGLRVFEGAAAVSSQEFWAFGATARGVIVAVYFRGGKAEQIYRLGQMVPAEYLGLCSIAVPRTSSPNGDCYLVIYASDNPFGSSRWILYVLKTDGSFYGYPIPADGNYCDGLSIYQPGDVRIMLTEIWPVSGSHLYGFANGVFREIMTFPERVHLESYPTPADGWGLSFARNAIYHWTGGALTPAVPVDGTLVCLSMASATEGWAGGLRGTSRARTPALWHYSDAEPSLTPTSLGRVKGAFK